MKTPDEAKAQFVDSLFEFDGENINIDAVKKLCTISTGCLILHEGKKPVLEIDSNDPAFLRGVTFGIKMVFDSSSPEELSINQTLHARLHGFFQMVLRAVQWSN